MTGEYSSIEPLIENGKFEFFSDDSTSVKVLGQYKNGLMVGDWEYGNSRTVNYDLILECDNDSSDVNVIVETMPKFQDKDLNAFRQYIATNLLYPPRPEMKSISGRLLVEFIINKDGEVCNPKIVSRLHKDLEQEALRVISHSPGWTPALQKGSPVNTQITFPVTFILQK
jgi:TonB family protein